jgi:hypothetical protein
MSGEGEIVLRERGNTLIVSERRDGALVTLMQVTAGAVTAIQREYFRANVLGRIKQVEADLILKYFYDIDIE